MPSRRIPSHLKAPEIKRRVTALAEAMRANGMEPGAIVMETDGTIRLLDKDTATQEGDGYGKGWKGAAA